MLSGKKVAVVMEGDQMVLLIIKYYSFTDFSGLA